MSLLMNDLDHSDKNHFQFESSDDQRFVLTILPVLHQFDNIHIRLGAQRAIPLKVFLLVQNLPNLILVSLFVLLHLHNNYHIVMVRALLHLLFVAILLLNLYLQLVHNVGFYRALEFVVD